MNIQFRQGSEAIPEKLIVRAERYLEKLARRIDERDAEALAYVDIDRESGSAHSERMWRSSIKLTHGRDQFNASAQGTTPDQATDRALKEIKREVTAARSRSLDLYRRGGSLLKRLRRGFN